MNIRTLAVLLGLFLSSLPVFGAEGLVGYWKLNEGEGINVLDSSGHGADGEIIGNATWEPEGDGAVLRFDGETSYVSIPDGVWNVAAGEITILCQFFSDNEKGDVLNHMATGVVPGSFALSASGGLSGFGEVFSDDDWQQFNFRVNLPVMLSQWHHVAITIKGTRVSGYLDGEFFADAEINSFPQARGPLHIGARGEVPDNFFSGLIREVAIFDRALTAEEIVAFYESYQKGEAPIGPDSVKQEASPTPALPQEPNGLHKDQK